MKAATVRGPAWRMSRARWVDRGVGGGGGGLGARGGGGGAPGGDWGRPARGGGGHQGGPAIGGKEDAGGGTAAAATGRGRPRPPTDEARRVNGNGVGPRGWVSGGGRGRDGREGAPQGRAPPPSGPCRREAQRRRHDAGVEGRGQGVSGPWAKLGSGEACRRDRLGRGTRMHPMDRRNLVHWNGGCNRRVLRGRAVHPKAGAEVGSRTAG